MAVSAYICRMILTKGEERRATQGKQRGKRENGVVENESNQIGSRVLHRDKVERTGEILYLLMHVYDVCYLGAFGSRLMCCRR